MIQVRKYHVPILSHQTLSLSQRLTLSLLDLEYPRGTPCDKRVCKTARLPTTGIYGHCQPALGEHQLAISVFIQLIHGS